MCGVCGIYSPQKYQEKTKHLRLMQSLLIHRGPDSQGIYENDHLGLAVCRLSIIDITDSDQPLFNEDKSLILAYNGMIYNFKELRKELKGRGHRFRTKGDGEVILHLYEEKGPECFKFLHGMFALSIFDRKQDSLIIARDHFGIKPLYYHCGPDKFLFSSEIKAVIESGIMKNTIDSDSLNLYLSYNYIPGKKTIYKDLFKLLPGHFLEIKKNLTFKVKPFWRINSQKAPRTNKNLSIKNIKNNLDYLLGESIKKHIQSDVEVGCFLSGGLDSSSIVHFLRKNNIQRLKTFSVIYDNKHYDERIYARSASKTYGTEHMEVECNETAVIQFLENLPKIGDSLVADQSSVSTYLVSRLARKYVKVSLSGEGADELFLGYPTYRANFLYPLFKHCPSAWLDFLEKMVLCFPASDKKVSFDYKLLRFIQGLKFKNIQQAHPYWRTIFPSKDKRAIFKKEILGQINIDNIYKVYYERMDTKDISPGYFANADLTTWLASNSLLKTDIHSMSNSLEVRVPFLYLPLVEYVISLPFNVRFNMLRDKYLLKELMKNRLEHKIIQRKKQGWHMPLASWLRLDFFDYCYDIFNSKHKLFDSFIDRKECINLLIRHKKRKENNSFKIWGLLVLLKHIKA